MSLLPAVICGIVLGCAREAVDEVEPPQERKATTVPLDRSNLAEVRERAEAGEPEAQFALGERFASGEGVDQDPARAAEWFGKAAEQGNAAAQLFLGNQYAAGQGVPEDAAEAVRWYMAAAEQGLDSTSSAAQFLLGVAYYTGKGIEQNYEEAYFWLELASGSGEAAAGGLSELAASRFTFERLAEIQQRVKSWRESHGS